MKITQNTDKPGKPKIFYIFDLDGKSFVIGTQHKLYNLRYKMIQRCYNAKPSEFKNYQGKGIIVCEEWRNDPESFFRFCLSKGWVAGLQLDRIDSAGNYEPSNVQIVTAFENTRRANIGRVGEKSANVKITEKIAIQIKELICIGMRICDIAKKCDTTWDIVKDIKRGKTWKHI